MLTRAYFSRAIQLVALFLMAGRLYAQVDPSASGGAQADDETQMVTPPPVSSMPYPNSAGSDTRSNYMETSVAVTPAYIDNVLPGANIENGQPGATVTSVGAVTYSIDPSFSFDKTTPRQREQIAYNPSFSFYEPTSTIDVSTLDAIDQSGTLQFQFGLSPHVSLNVQDSFLRTSNVFNQSYPFSDSVSGSTLTSTPAVIAPFEEQLANTTGGGINYQFGKDAMIGAGGAFGILDFPNTSQEVNLFNSHQFGGQAYYNRRLSRGQYIGLGYQYERILSYPANGVDTTQTYSFLPYYSLYFNRTFSLSISAGAEYVNVAPFEQPASKSWSPEADLSFGWQINRANIAASFSREVIAGGGLLGAYDSSRVAASAAWKLARTWNSAVSISYVAIDTLTTPIALSPVETGNTLSGQFTLARTIGEHFSAGFTYQHLHENYAGIAVITASPDTNREAFTISYRLRRPLGK
jgi:hypothetical protein